MPQTISTPAQYAIRTLIHVARRPGKGARVRDIASEESIPQAFLAKLIGRLVRTGFIRSQRGPRGGVWLARPAEEISVLEVVRAVDGPDAFEGCFLGFPVCGEENPCPLHEDWGPMRQALIDRLGAIRLADLAELEQRRREASGERPPSD